MRRAKGEMLRMRTAFEGEMNTEMKPRGRRENRLGWNLSMFDGCYREEKCLPLFTERSVGSSGHVGDLGW